MNDDEFKYLRIVCRSVAFLLGALAIFVGYYNVV